MGPEILDILLDIPRKIGSDKLLKRWRALRDSNSRPSDS